MGCNLCTLRKREDHYKLLYEIAQGTGTVFARDRAQCEQSNRNNVIAPAGREASEDLLKDHYRDLQTKPFFDGLVRYMGSGPVVAMVWQGLDVVKTCRRMLGETNPADSLPGTVRGDYCVEVGRNVIHGSDSVESAQREISLWFRNEEIQCWEDPASPWIYA
ncbi:unnamed protein product [Boreogadus saida]